MGTAEVVSVATWYLWWIRRTVTHNERTPPAASWKLSVLSLCTNFTKAAQGSHNGELVKWTKPELCQVKLNVDASYHSEEGAGAMGAIIRDKHDNFLAGACAFAPHASSASMMEAQAMKEGLTLAASLGFHHIVAESDCLEVIEACGGGHSWWSKEAAIYADCVDLVAEIGTVQFSHCLREVNGVAHEIANIVMTTFYLVIG